MVAPTGATTFNTYEALPARVAPLYSREKRTEF
jgi:hypothetical protein